MNNGAKVWDCRGLGHHGQTCLITDCIEFECSDDYHCESNPFNPNVPSFICNYDFCSCPNDYYGLYGQCQLIQMELLIIFSHVIKATTVINVKILALINLVSFKASAQIKQMIITLV